MSRYHSIGQFTAYKAEQILVNKVPPATIPIETLTRFSLQVRMDVAEALKLPPPLPMFNYAELIVPSEAESPRASRGLAHQRGKQLAHDLRGLAREPERKRSSVLPTVRCRREPVAVEVDLRFAGRTSPPPRGCRSSARGGGR